MPTTPRTLLAPELTQRRGQLLNHAHRPRCCRTNVKFKEQPRQILKLFARKKK